jgi:hypothetical protein
MAKLPARPPALADLQAIAPIWKLVPAGSLWWRVFAGSGPHPSNWSQFRSWGPSSSRFDHHLLGPDGKSCTQARAILYAAARFDTCLAEYFQARRLIDRSRDDVTVVAFEVARPVKLLDLWGPFSTQLGASGVLSSGPHGPSRAWSRALYEAYPSADGLHYESSMLPGSPAMAIWERAVNAVPAVPRLHRALADPVLWVPLDNAARLLGYGLL